MAVVIGGFALAVSLVSIDGSANAAEAIGALIGGVIVAGGIYLLIRYLQVRSVGRPE